MGHRFLNLCASLLGLTVSLTTASLPYNPTRILSQPDDNNQLLYVFRSTEPVSSTFQLLALNISKTIAAANPSYTTISDPLPFLVKDTESSFIPILDERGDIFVYAGACQNAAIVATLWKFTQRLSPSDGYGNWAEIEILKDEVTNNKTGLVGANYLASGIAFSSTISGPADMYIFGGMCPNPSPNPVDNWIQSGNYSNEMISIQSKSTSSGSAQFTLGTSSSKAPPVAEAGYSLTPLEPTYSNSSDGVQNRNQNFVMLGGHTKEAFINMSTVALLTLPQESWTFLPIEQPNAPKTDLAVRNGPPMDPRSGHSAVLTSDGKGVIVFGGWVGDVTNPATPQLAILEIGEGYGGTGEWQWTAPSQSGPGPNTGLYGHGATMLPGGVMMVVGGYSIPASGSTVRKRADPSLNAQNYFYNVTSGSWMTSYTHPVNQPGRPDLPQDGADHMTATKRVGLGAGLAFGVAALIAVGIVYFWYCRRLRRRREAREEELRKLSLGVRRPHISEYGLEDSQYLQGQQQMEERFAGPKDAYPWSHRASDSTDTGTARAERTGLLVEIPSPTRGLRRSLQPRGAYHSAPRYDDSRRSHGSGNIHPIDERDEYEVSLKERALSAKSSALQRTNTRVYDNVPGLDPFHDPAQPTDVSRTPSPQSPAREREREVQNWVSDWSAADAILHNHQRAGRTSPEKSDRTSSSLSEQSTRSYLSAQSIQRSVNSISRSMSQRSAAFLNANVFSPADRMVDMSKISDDKITSHSPQDYDPSFRRSQSLTLFPRRPTASDTYTPAATSFAQLRSEGEALLGGNEPLRSGALPNRTRSRATGWMGSVRRAFSGRDRSISGFPEHGESSSPSSPVKPNHGNVTLPRRAASTSAMLWQKKQGAKDWNVGGGHGVDEGVTPDGEADYEDWDVESAVERRVVQVMFTVPKEKLRVVNRGPEGDGESILSVEARNVEVVQGNTTTEDTGRSEEKYI